MTKKGAEFELTDEDSIAGSASYQQHGQEEIIM